MSAPLENRLENSPYSKPQDHSRRDLALKKAAQLRRERLAKEANDSKQREEKRFREETDMRHREDRERRYREDVDMRHREERELRRREISYREESLKNDTRHREERDSRLRQDKSSGDQKVESQDSRHPRDDSRHRKDESRLPRDDSRHRKDEGRLPRDDSRHRKDDGRQPREDRRHPDTSATLVVPPAVRPPPLLKPIYRGHVTVDTSKARSNIDVVRRCIHDLGWREVIMPRREPCDFYWHAIGFQDHSDLTSGRVNKFPGIQEMLSKINLCRTLDFMRNLFPSDYDFYPRSWFLPYQFHEFSNEVRQLTEKKVKPKPTYIVKPSEGSQGEGIYLLREPTQYNSHNGRCHIVQEYLSNVFLLEKFKFDLRVYVTVTSVEPLEFYICKEGLARFSTIPYENPTNKNLQEVFMHLTNYSLNKRSSTFNQSEKDEEGSKRKLTSVFQQMNAMGHDTEWIWEEIERIVCKTMIAVVGDLKIHAQTSMPTGKPGPRCFQILGFDILLLKNLKPILLEVNANPSLSIFGEQEVLPGVFECVESLKDEEVKVPLVKDTFLLIAPKNKFTRKNCRQHRRRRNENNANNQQRQGETAIIIKMEEMTVVKETAIRIMDPSMEVDDGDKKDDSNDKSADDSDARTDSDDRGTDSDNKMEEGDSGREEYDSGEEGDEEEEEKDDEDKESCLKRIYPDVYGTQFDYLRLMERLATLFTKSLGVRGAHRIGSTAFRMFARKCRLNRRGVTNASVDILYIDYQRKWEFMNPDRTSGLGFQGFVDACFEISRRKFFKTNRRDMLESFICYCEEGLNEHKQEEEALRRRFSRPPRRLLRRPVHLFQRATVTSLEEESVHSVYEHPLVRRSLTFAKSSEFSMLMSQKRKQTYKPKPLSLYSSDDD
ncbi:tubulin polyglutamylase TTLL11-like [Haliotis rufescens]|uniref:tubulin polyglutamylase TTLL11-like n=1 Tax=Haliotis rufescens TaxID=6454 RepID=UPI00201E9F8B|nr:tubulin polyglutamylase TTLL11-like [Haliotis rufescens]